MTQDTFIVSGPDGGGSAPVSSAGKTTILTMPTGVSNTGGTGAGTVAIDNATVTRDEIGIARSVNRVLLPDGIYAVNAFVGQGNMNSGYFPPISDDGSTVLIDVVPTLSLNCVRYIQTPSFSVETFSFQGGKSDGQYASGLPYTGWAAGAGTGANAFWGTGGELAVGGVFEATSAFSGALQGLFSLSIAYSLMATMLQANGDKYLQSSGGSLDATDGIDNGGMIVTITQLAELP